MMSKTAKVSVTISILFAIFGFVGLWKWALFGMDAEVCIAWILTTIIGVTLSAIGSIEI